MVSVLRQCQPSAGRETWARSWRASNDYHEIPQLLSFRRRTAEESATPRPPLRVRPRLSLPHPPISPAASTWPRNPDLRVHLPQPSRRPLAPFPAPATSHALLWRHRARGGCPSTSGATESSG